MVERITELAPRRAHARDLGEEEFPHDELDLAQRFEYLCTIGRKGHEGGTKVA